MTELNFKDFLTCGAFLQTGPDLFKLLIGPFQKRDNIEVDLQKSSVLFYRPNFWDFLHISKSSCQDSVYEAELSYDVSREEFIHLLKSLNSQKADITWNPVQEEDFKSQFEWSQQCFVEGTLVKSVPIICQTGAAQFDRENLVWSLLSLIQMQNFGWSYGYFDQARGCIGHTPEILVQWTSAAKQLQTVALAGTYAKSESAFQEIIQDQKILNEHQIVIDDIKNKLQKFSLSQGATRVLELKHLLHLITEFTMPIETRDQALDVIAALHPTSAMGIFPSSPSHLDVFSKFELQKKRGAFAAPLALIEKEAVHCIVAIRNLFFDDKEVQIYSGCGVTADSDYELELAEVQNKRDSVKKMVGLL